jgi:hypothetical protein
LSFAAMSADNGPDELGTNITAEIFYIL